MDEISCLLHHIKDNESLFCHVLKFQKQGYDKICKTASIVLIFVSCHMPSLPPGGAPL